MHKLLTKHMRVLGGAMKVGYISQMVDLFFNTHVIQQITLPVSQHRLLMEKDNPGIGILRTIGILTEIIRSQRPW